MQGICFPVSLGSGGSFWSWWLLPSRHWLLPSISYFGCFLHTVSPPWLLLVLTALAAPSVKTLAAVRENLTSISESKGLGAQLLCLLSTPSGDSSGQVQNLRQESGRATEAPWVKCRRTGSIGFQELIPLCSVVAPNGIRVGRDDCRRGGPSEWRVWEPAAHAALCGLREFLPFLPPAQQQT